MSINNTTILAIVELAIYLLLLPQTIWLAHRHGRHGILGYIYLNITCGVRIIADIVQIAERNHTGPPTIAVVVLGSIGLSPLMLAVAGFLHEIHHYLLLSTTTSHKKLKSTSRWLWFAQVQIHAIVATGMILVIIGSVSLIKAKTQKEVNDNNALRSAGAVILLVLWLGLLLYSLWLLYRASKNIGTRVLWQLSAWTLAAVTFVGVKVTYAVVYTFDHQDVDINPVTGTIAVKTVLVVGVSLLAVLAMVVGGWKSRGIGRARERVQPYRPVHEQAFAHEPIEAKHHLPRTIQSLERL